MFGPARTNAIQVRKFQNNRRCSLNIENETRGISGFVHPVMTSPTAKLRPPGHPGILATPPDESRYGEQEVKSVFELYFCVCARVVTLGDLTPRDECCHMDDVPSLGGGMAYLLFPRTCC